MFAFFVVLYASSQVDKRRVGRLAMAIQVAFQELGVFDTSNTKLPLSQSEAMPFAKVPAVENVQRSGDMERFVQPMKGVLSSSLAVPLKDVRTELEKTLGPEIQSRVVDIKSKKEGPNVSLREVGFYESGSSAMRSSSTGAIDRLAAVLASRTENMRIEGHADNVPIHNRNFDSNWELSTARVTKLAKLFIYKYHIVPARLSASGFAEFRLVGDNATMEGLAINRRIDIVILNPVLGEKSPFGASSPAVNSPPAVSPGTPAAPQANAVPQGPSLVESARRGSSLRDRP